jgi:hypothetical protein
LVALRAVRVSLPDTATKDEMQSSRPPADQVLNIASPAAAEALPSAAPSLLAFHHDESLASYPTYLACLQLELKKTAQIIREVRSCPSYGSDSFSTSDSAFDSEDYRRLLQQESTRVQTAF